MTTFQRQVLEAFANMGAVSSKWEAFGATSGPQVDAAIAALRVAGLLVVAEGSRDAHGGTRFEVSAKGRQMLGWGATFRVLTRKPKPSGNGQHKVGA